MRFSFFWTLGVLLCVSSGLWGAAAEGKGLSLRFAKGFGVEPRTGYSLLTVREPWPGAGRDFQYALYPQGATPPGDIPKGATPVPVPIRTAAALSTSHAAYLEALGVADRLVAVSEARYFTSPTVVKGLADGKIREIGGDGPDTNVELLYAIAPDIVLAYNAGDPSYDKTGRLLNAGFKIAMVGEYREETPLARAEWIKFFGLLFGREKEAEARFDEVARRYATLKEAAARTKTRPTVFCNLAFKGTWYMPRGQSFFAHFLADAGANYLWRDEKGRGTLPLGMETVMARALDADFWLNANEVRTLAEIKASDPRYAAFRAFRERRVYTNARSNDRAGNDFFESGVVYPDRILEDLTRIFHPDIAPPGAFHYYFKLK